VGRSVEFDITADAPMNSFWIPALGGQMYAMTGMTTILHLEATTAGDYPGMSANYSGEGFAQMKFTARALSADDFQTWVEAARKSQDVLSETTYASLRTPSMTGPVRYYSKVDMPFADILSSYMPEMKAATPSMTDMMHH
jgi:cytochrome o ubiquinol oxidase subunit 2